LIKLSLGLRQAPLEFVGALPLLLGALLLLLGALPLLLGALLLLLGALPLLLGAPSRIATSMSKSGIA
jgi:hypothetical protein